MGLRANPFIKTTTAPESEEPQEVVLHDSLLGAQLMESGPASPDALPISPEDVTSDTWPKVRFSAIPETRITVMGLHGGAGASTLAALMGEGVGDHGREWRRWL